MLIEEESNCTVVLAFKSQFLICKNGVFLPGVFCPAISKAVKTMKKNEKAHLTVMPQCESAVC